jgi:hypothetical protein
MPSVDQAFGSKVTITCTLTSLADSASQQSNSWDMGVGNQIDEFVLIGTNAQSGGTDYVFVYVYGAIEAGISPKKYTDGATGLNSTFTTASIKNSPLLGSIAMNAATAVRAGPFSIASAFGGFLPAEGGLIVNNEANSALSATSGDHVLEYVPVYITSA